MRCKVLLTESGIDATHELDKPTNATETYVVEANISSTGAIVELLKMRLAKALRIREDDVRVLQTSVANKVEALIAAAQFHSWTVAKS